MSLSMLANIATMILCAAVLIQSVRLMHALKTVRASSMLEMVKALDRATGDARGVLTEMKIALGEAGRSSRVIADGKAMAEELSMMVGIANASADRMADMASVASRQLAAEAV